MIVYRKGTPLRIRRAAWPSPPWWCATVISPYAAKRATPIAVDFVELRATQAAKLDSGVAEDVASELERSELRTPIAPPALIDAAEFSEVVFRRGAEALRYCSDHRLPSTYLTSVRGALAPADASLTTIVIGVWPLEFHRLDALCEAAAAQPAAWGLAIPVIFPVTTDLTALAEIVATARRHGAHFVAAVPLEIDQGTKGELARSLSGEDDEELYDTLFHADLESIHTATERHVAALAHEAGLADFVLPPRWEERSNWNAAILLTLVATRMLAMEYEVELAGTLARSARLIAALDKPLERVAEAASLSIIEALDEVSVDILTEWIESGRSSFVERIHERWRLRRDYDRSE